MTIYGFTKLNYTMSCSKVSILFGLLGDALHASIKTQWQAKQNNCLIKFLKLTDIHTLIN